MTVKEAVEYIDNYTWSTSKLGLERTTELLEKMGNPQDSLRFVHVTGSNGKGSTCVMTESVLRAAGYKTGLFTSPYVCDFNERIQVNRVNISDEELADITGYVASFADAMEDHPTQFELITAIGMEYFKRCGCEIVVLEVGMGGAMDSTNVIKNPEVCAFTNIGLEHTEYLGNTLREIATTKGGIIKAGATVVCYDGEPEVNEVLLKISKDKGNKCIFASGDNIESLPVTIDGQRFTYKGSEYDIGLLGRHQLYNASVAIEITEALRDRGFAISEEALKRGLENAVWPARFEILRREPLFILDGGHNPQCAEALADTLKDVLKDVNGGKAIFLTGTLKDKDYHKIAETISAYAEKLVIVTPDNPRALPAKSYAEVFTNMGIEASACDSVAAGVTEVLKTSGNKPVVAFGSLYMAGEIRRLVLNR